jgi:hypothetical protein
VSITILAVKLWGMASSNDASLKRYSVYYKREGRVWRSLVDAIDEIAAWRKFHEVVDHKATQGLTTYLPEQEQEYHGFTESRAQTEEGQD